MKTLILQDNDQFYAPATDECWVHLAKSMMDSYSKDYVILAATSAKTQSEYDTIDTKVYAPARRNILKNIKHGPLRNVVDMNSTFSALENLRKTHLRDCETFWKDTFVVDLDNL